MFTALLLLLLLFQPNDNIKIKDAWMRPGAKDMSTALYFTIENTGGIADTLYKAESDIAGKVELHETYQNGDMMGMRKVEMMVAEPKSKFELKPGSHHVMVMKLKSDIKEGDEAKFKLHFKQSGLIEITAKAKKN
jgi:copper(I)-binding protein